MASSSSGAPLQPRQGKLLVGYQGAAGAYVEGAAIELFGGHPCFRERGAQTVPHESLKLLFTAVRAAEVELAIVPIENSYSGTLYNVYEQLGQFKDLHVVGEYSYQEPHCLLALPGVGMADLREVRSHTHVVEQCSRTLAEHFGRAAVSIALASDTASAAQAVQLMGRRDLGAIAGERAASLYGLNVLVRGMEDDSKCTTRYLLVGRERATLNVPGDYRTSYIVSLINQPGQLFKALSCFALRDVNVSKIESRPSTRVGTATNVQPWEYMLYIDADGPLSQPPIKNATANLEEFSRHMRVLGSYPRYASARASAGHPVEQLGPFGL